MDLTLDHVPYACRDLDAATAELKRLGLAPEYGGVHDNGVTHMSILGFDDDTYLELISETDRGDHGFWPEHIRADAGPAAWCVRVDDAVAECRRVLDAGYPVFGPFYGSRERDDGTLVEWDRAEFGTHEQRLLFPFAIADRTPRSVRITPSASVRDGPLTGVGQVVLAVDRLDDAIETFRDCYRCPRPRRTTVSGLGEVASFLGQPLAVATPGGTDWLRARLDAFRDGPCTCLLATRDLDAARRVYPLGESRAWPDGRVAFFDSDYFGRRLGVVERTIS
ncbi:MAG: VOC family protein [Haloarculaceae archaeon]